MNDFSTYVHGVKAKLGLTSDRQLAIKLQMSYSIVHRILHSDIVPSDKTCLKIAMIAGDDPSSILLLKQKVKASETTKPYWDKIFKTCATAVLVFVLVLPLLPFPSGNDASAFDTMYIIINVR